MNAGNWKIDNSAYHFSARVHFIIWIAFRWLHFFSPNTTSNEIGDISRMLEWLLSQNDTTPSPHWPVVQGTAPLQVAQICRGATDNVWQSCTTGTNTWDWQVWQQKRLFTAQTPMLMCIKGPLSDPTANLACELEFVRCITANIFLINSLI